MKQKKHKKEDCFYFTGVYCENTHEYECTRGHCACSACFEYMNWWQRLCMTIEVELLQRRIWLDSIFHKRKLFRKKTGKRNSEMSKYIDLASYAPAKCKHFVCGDCTIQHQADGDFKSCHTDYPECEKAEWNGSNDEDFDELVTELN